MLHLDTSCELRGVRTPTHLKMTDSPCTAVMFSDPEEAGSEESEGDCEYKVIETWLHSRLARLRVANTSFILLLAPLSHPGATVTILSERDGGRNSSRNVMIEESSWPLRQEQSKTDWYQPPESGPSSNRQFGNQSPSTFTTSLSLWQTELFLR